MRKEDNEPYAVFDRVAQLEHDRLSKCQAIQELQDELRAIEEEWQEIELIALAYLAQKPGRAVVAAAWDRTLLGKVDFALADDGAGLAAFKIERAGAYNRLSTEALLRARMASEDEGTDDRIYPSEVIQAFRLPVDAPSHPVDADSLNGQHQ